MSKSLAEFAEGRPARRHRASWLTTIPERAEVDSYLQAGGSPVIVAEWLREKYGKEATTNRVRYYQEHYLDSQVSGGESAVPAGRQPQADQRPQQAKGKDKRGGGRSVSSCQRCGFELGPSPHIGGINPPECYDCYQKDQLK